jgi:hypothetical protein
MSISMRRHAPFPFALYFVPKSGLHLPQIPDMGLNKALIAIFLCRKGSQPHLLVHPYIKAECLYVKSGGCERKQLLIKKNISLYSSKVFPAKPVAAVAEPDDMHS